VVTDSTAAELNETLDAEALDAIDQLRDCGRLFHQRGWSVGTSSNYSAVLRREPLQLIITASGKDKGRLDRDDFVIVDSQGKPVRAGQLKSSAETLLHCCAAKDQSVNAVLHTHSVWGTILSDHYFDPAAPQSGFRIEGYEMLKGLEGITTHETSIFFPIFENTQDIPRLAEEVQQYLDANDGCCGYLIRRHGMYTWGKSIEAARRHVEILEFLFEVLGRRLTL
jgi:methylthioribulose-1-phosphate dehydratase